jgi:hypothetical protein
MTKTVALLFDSGRTAWPDADLKAEAIVRRLSLAISAGDLKYPSDFYLALACAEGAPPRCSLGGNDYSNPSAPLLRASIPRGRSPCADEVKQRLRERLLVGSITRIVGYRGQGPLGAWLRVASVRIAIDISRADGATRRT